MTCDLGVSLARPHPGLSGRLWLGSETRSAEASSGRHSSVCAGVPPLMSPFPSQPHQLFTTHAFPGARHAAPNTRFPERAGAPGLALTPMCLGGRWSQWLIEERDSPGR